MSRKFIISVCLRVSVGTAVLLLVFWQYFHLRVLDNAVKHYSAQAGVPSMLLSAARSWASEANISEDQVQEVNEEFVGVLFGNNNLNHAYIIGIDKSVIINSEQNYKLLVDGDQDGYFKNLIPLSGRVALILENVSRSDSKVEDNEPEDISSH